ncbi:hypothetical protein GIB67_039410, partial [Kingdonia uniflora]
HDPRSLSVRGSSVIVDCICHVYNTDEWSSALYHCSFWRGNRTSKDRINCYLCWRKYKTYPLRAHSSYEDFVTLLEETSKIRPEDWLSTTKDTGSGRGLSTTKAGGPLRHNSFPDPEPEYRGYPETNGRWLDPCRLRPFVDDENDSLKTICTDVPPSDEPSIPQSNVHLSNEPVLTNVPQSNEPYQTIPTNVPLSNEPSILQSSIHLSNEPVLTNVPPSNEPILTNVPFSIEPETIIGQTEPSAEFRFELQPEQVKDLLDWIELKNHIRAYAVVNKFNLKHILSNEYKIMERCKGHKCFWQIYMTRSVGSAIFRMRGSFQHAYQLLKSYFAKVRLVNPDFVFDIQTTSCKDKRFTKYFWCFGPPKKLINY